MKLRCLAVLAALWALAGYALWVGTDVQSSAAMSAANSVKLPPLDGREFDDLFNRLNNGPRFPAVNRTNKSSRFSVPENYAPFYRGPYTFAQSVIL